MHAVLGSTIQVCIPVYCAQDGLLLPQKPVQKCICLVKQQHRGQQGGGISAKCEVMGFCLKLATLKKGGGVYPFCAQLKFSKTRRGGLPWMCTSAYFPIFWACRRKFGGVLLQK